MKRRITDKPTSDREVLKQAYYWILANRGSHEYFSAMVPALKGILEQSRTIDAAIRADRAGRKRRP